MDMEIKDSNAEVQALRTDDAGKGVEKHTIQEDAANCAIAELTPTANGYSKPTIGKLSDVSETQEDNSDDDDRDNSGEPISASAQGSACETLLISENDEKVNEVENKSEQPKKTNDQGVGSHQTAADHSEETEIGETADESGGDGAKIEDDQVVQFDGTSRDKPILPTEGAEESKRPNAIDDGMSGEAHGSRNLEDQNSPDQSPDSIQEDPASAEGERRQKRPLSRRNKSVGSFRRFFQKHRHSASVGGLRSDSGSFLSNSPSSPRDPSSPSTPLADDVFNLCELTASIAQSTSGVKSASESEESAATARRRHSFRSKFASLPGYTRSQSQMDERGSVLWKRAQKAILGSFSFSRQLSPSGQGPDQSCFHSENKVDTVYQVLREGIILRTCKDSTNGSDSLQRTSSAESNPSPGASDAKPGSRTSSPLLTQRNDQPQPETSGASPLHRTEKGRSSPAQDTQEARADEQASSNKRTNNRCVSPGENAVGEPPTETRGQLKMQQMERLAEEGNLYVALYKFEAQQRDDLSLRPGDRINVTNDKDESWWIGECENRHGFFPANFVMGVRPTEQICNCTQPTTLKDTGNKEIPLKRNQVLAIRLDWPVSDPSYVYARSPSAEGYVRKEDLKPL